MKILFFISLNSHGRGGHLYSLHNIANELAKSNSVGIVSIGPGDNSVISENNNYLKHIYFNGIKLIKFKKESKSIIENFNPDIIHCFDVASYNVIRLFYSSGKIKLVLNKCGGANPVLPNFPYAKNLVLFSLENKFFFERSKKYKKSNIAIIPNRVKKVETIFTDIVKLENNFNFVKISRIGNTYINSIFDSINFIEFLIEEYGRKNIKLYIIGVIENEELYKKLLENRSVINGNVILLTEDKYTKNASKMLYIADACIATGRGVMEAASLKKPVLTINSESNTPVLLTDKTFISAFKTNFSPRNIFPELDSEENIQNIGKLLDQDDYYKFLSNYIYEQFNSNFDILGSAKKYEDFYKSIDNSSFIYRFSDMNLIFKTLYGFFINSSRFKKNKWK